MADQKEDVIARVQAWYSRCCNGVWEHQYGVKIDTLDNPGWSVVIDLAGTPLEAAAFPEVKTAELEQDWIHCRVRDRRFEGHGGPATLGLILKVFLAWSDHADRQGSARAGEQPDAADEAGLRTEPRR